MALALTTEPSIGQPAPAATGTSTNWMRNVVLTQADVTAPSSIEELQRCVSTASPPVRVLGSGHSFTPLCDCDGAGTRVSLHGMRRVWGLRATDDSASIFCEGGTQFYHDCNHRRKVSSS